MDGADTTNPIAYARGLDVLDLSLSKRIRHGVDFNFSCEAYYEPRMMVEWQDDFACAA